jgi:hypothetical protein
MTKKQISLLPWLEITEIGIGNVIFWKYDPSLIDDSDIRTYLDQYTNCYVDKHLKPLKSVTIASFKDKNNFEVLTEEEYGELSFARDTLCFLCIAEQTRIGLESNNVSIGPPSADIFEMFSQNFIPGTDDIAVKAGSQTSEGWKLHKIHFQEPWSTGGFFKNINKHVYTAINQLLLDNKYPELANRLLRSFELFRLAHIENGTVSQFYKIVMMSTAFEIIFDIPNIPNKSGYIADEIDKTIAQGFKTEGRKSNKNQDESRSKAGWWGWDFYKLRNSVVHGSGISITDLIYIDWITQLIVADVVFYAYVAHLLFKEGYIDHKLNLPDFHNTYKILGWVS